MTSTCACGGRLTTPDGITGYYPTVPHKCVVCGVVTYVDMTKQAKTQEATRDSDEQR